MEGHRKVAGTEGTGGFGAPDARAPQYVIQPPVREGRTRCATLLRQRNAALQAFLAPYLKHVEKIRRVEEVELDVDRDLAVVANRDALETCRIRQHLVAMQVKHAARQRLPGR